MKWSEGLSSRVSNINRRYTDHMKCAAYMDMDMDMDFPLSHSFIFLWFHFLSYGCMFCVLLLNFVNCESLL